MGRVFANLLRARAVRSLVGKLEEHLPPLRAWHRFEYDVHFEAQSSEKVRMFRGIYHSRQAALAALPPNLRFGHDHAEAADRHASEIGRIWPSDYPVLFWLKSLLAENPSLFELGGNVGLAFYGFQKYLREYPKDLRWKICEVPAVAKLGSKLATEHPSSGLAFTTEMDDASGFAILMASGVVQFLEEPLWVSLQRLKKPPGHLLLNRVPLCEESSFVTLHNIGPVTCLYEIRNRSEFTEHFLRLGYTLVDSWEAPEFSCYIPFHADRAVKAFSGLYFRMQ